MASFTSILALFEAAGLTLKNIGNGKFSTVEHDSLILHSTGKFANFFFWNSLGVGGNIQKAQQILQQQGYFFKQNSPFESFKSLPKEVFTTKKRFSQAEKIDFALQQKNNLLSPFHTFSRKLGLWDSQFKTMHIAAQKIKETNYTLFYTYSIDNQLLSIKKINYLDNAKRNKQNPFAIQTIHHEKALFGCFLEHLFDPNKKTIIVESEKTAAWATHFFSDYNWLATGGKNGAKNLEASFQRIKNSFPDYPNAHFAQLIDYDLAGANAPWDKHLPFELPKFVVKNAKHKGYDVADLLADKYFEGGFHKTNFGKLSLNDFLLPLHEYIELFDERHLAKMHQLEGKKWTFKQKNSLLLQTKYLGQDAVFQLYFEAFFDAHQRICLQAPCGIGKSEYAKSLIINLLKEKKHPKVLFLTNRLSNTKDFSKRAESLKKQVKVWVESSDLGNFENSCDGLENAQLIISTFASAEKTLPFIDENTLIIVDEIHKADEFSSRFFHFLEAFQGKIWGLSATPNPLYNHFFKLQNFVVSQHRSPKKTTIFHHQKPFEAFLNHWASQEKVKTLVSLATINECEQAFALAQAYGISARIIHAQNKSEWEKDVQNGTFGNFELILMTKVIEAGIDILDSDIQKVVFVDHRNYFLDNKNLIQTLNRLRNIPQVEIEIFRDKHQRNGMDAWLAKGKLEVFAHAFASQKNGYASQIHTQEMHDIALQIKYKNLTRWNEKVSSYGINYKYVLSLANEWHQKSLSNTDFLAEISHLEAFVTHFSDYQFQAEKEISTSQKAICSQEVLKNCRKAKKAAQEKELQRQKAVLETAHDIAQLSGSLVLKKRVENFMKLGLFFDKAKELVLQHFSEVGYHNELKRQKTRYLQRAKPEKLRANDLADKEVIGNFVEKIVLGKAYQVKDLQALWVENHIHFREKLRAEAIGNLVFEALFEFEKVQKRLEGEKIPKRYLVAKSLKTS